MSTEYQSLVALYVIAGELLINYHLLQTSKIPTEIFFKIQTNNIFLQFSELARIIITSGNLCYADPQKMQLHPYSILQNVLKDPIRMQRHFGRSKQHKQKQVKIYLDLQISPSVRLDHIKYEQQSNINIIGSIIDNMESIFNFLIKNEDTNFKTSVATIFKC